MFNLKKNYSYIFFIKHLKNYSLGKISFLLGAFSLKKLFKDLFLSYISFIEEIVF